jgi:ABC-type phosphate transport system substrate-binding protein
MQNSNWRMGDLRQRRLFGALRQSSKLRARRRFGLLLLGVTLLALVLLLSACTTQPQQPCEMQPLPMRPALSEPLPSVSYSSKVQSDTEAWAKRVTGTSQTSGR